MILDDGWDRQTLSKMFLRKDERNKRLTSGMGYMAGER